MVADVARKFLGLARQPTTNAGWLRAVSDAFGVGSRGDPFCLKQLKWALVGAGTAAAGSIAYLSKLQLDRIQMTFGVIDATVARSREIEADLEARVSALEEQSRTPEAA